MRIVFALIFLVGLGIAGFAVVLTMERFDAIEAQNTTLRNQARVVVVTKTVVVATQDIRYGQKLLPEHLREVPFPVEAIPPSAFSTILELTGEAGAAPRTVTRTMQKDEIVMRTKVTGFGESAGVSSRLKPGMRAFTISVDVTSGVSGFLKPGDRVDIYWTGQIGLDQTTRLLMQSVPLIAVDQVADEDATRPQIARTVTVEVTPQIVADLTQAQATGRLTLSLRGAEESDVSTATDVTSKSLFGIAAPTAVEVEKVCTTRERRGIEVVVTVVPCPEAP